MMGRISRLLCRVVPAGVIAATSAVTSAPEVQAMNAYKWAYRPVVVFADTEQDARLVQQKGIVSANRGGFGERQIVVVYVVGNTVTQQLGPAPGLQAGELRQRFGASSGGFKVVLLGKDGGVKLSSSNPLTAARLFGTVDAMPMRRDEMRGR